MKKTSNIKTTIFKNQEIYTFSKDNINIDVKINYEKNEISLVDDYGNGKKWLFAKRGVGFMNGWVAILSVMQDAIKDAKQRYEAELAERSKFKEESFEEFVDQVSDASNISLVIKNKKIK